MLITTFFSFESDLKSRFNLIKVTKKGKVKIFDCLEGNMYTFKNSEWQRFFILITELLTQEIAEALQEKPDNCPSDYERGKRDCVKKIQGILDNMDMI
jgi:hypothetical protein